MIDVFIIVMAPKVVSKKLPGSTSSSGTPPQVRMTRTEELRLAAKGIKPRSGSGSPKDGSQSFILSFTYTILSVFCLL